jgi:hypothetical protein
MEIVNALFYLRLVTSFIFHVPQLGNICGWEGL